MDGGAPQLRACPNCGAENAGAPALPYSWRDWTILSCGECGFVYLQNPPGYEAFETEFAWEHNHGDRAERMKAEHPVAHTLSRSVRGIRRAVIRKPDKFRNLITGWVPPGPVVELGCGAADRLAALPEAYEPVGIEISAGLAREAEAILTPRGGRVILMPALEGLQAMEAASVTGVLMRSFLEHELNPRDVLAQALRVLGPGGIALIKVPNYGSINRRVMGPRWCGFRFPGHVNYFTPHTLRRMVEAAGFEVARFGFTDRQPLSDNMWMLARKPAG